jgi:preprotein translocase subunit SecG
MEILILIIHVLAALAIIGLVLLQHGKGADVGAAFGGGASGSVFGASGSANFLSRTTAILAVVFFATSLGLTYFSAHKGEHRGVMATQPAPEPSLPAQIPGQGSSTSVPEKSAAGAQAPQPAAGAKAPEPAGSTGAPSKAPEVPK